MPGMGLFSAQHGVVSVAKAPSHDQLLQAYNRQFPKFMDSLLDRDVLPYLPTDEIAKGGKRFEDLTDDDLSAMYIPGRYKK